MTVPNQPLRADYNGNGVTTSFSVPWYFTDSSHIKVIHTAASVDTTWVIGTHYTVDGVGNQSGGIVQVKTSPTDYTPASGESLHILPNIPITQSVDFVDNESLPAATQEGALDKAYQVLRMFAEKLQRTYTLPESSTDTQAVTSLSTLTVLIDDFNRQYLGSKAADPTLDNEGDALVAGQLYYNTTTNEMKAYDGAAWNISYNPSPGSVDSFNGRTGAVAPTAGDYDYTDLTGVRHLGSKASDPTLDNDGNALVAGLVYFNSTESSLRYYDGSHWISLRDAVRPEDYGAVGDGSTDDTTALASAFTAAKAKTLLLTGSYSTDVFTVSGSNCPLRVISVGATIKQRGVGAQTILIENPQSGAGYKGTVWEGRLVVDANSTGTNAVKVHGLQDLDGIKASLRGIEAINAVGDGVALVGEPDYGIYGLNLCDISADNCGGRAVSLTSINNTSQYYVQAVLVENPRATNCAGGFYLDYAGATFIMPWAEGNSGPGFDMGHTQSLVVLGGHLENNLVSGVDTSIRGSVNTTYAKFYGTLATGAVTGFIQNTGCTLDLCGYSTAGTTDGLSVANVRAKSVALGSASYLDDSIAGGSAGIAMVIEGASAAKFAPDSELISGRTSFLVTYHNGSVQRLGRVTIGSSDSGGTGYRLLRVDN